MSFTIADVRAQLEALGFHDVSDAVVESFVKKLLAQQDAEAVAAEAAHQAYLASADADDDDDDNVNQDEHGDDDEDDEDADDEGDAYMYERPVHHHHGVHVLSPVPEESPSAVAPRPHATAAHSSDEEEEDDDEPRPALSHLNSHTLAAATHDEQYDVDDGDSQGTDVDQRGSFDAVPWMQSQRVTANSFFNERAQQLHHVAPSTSVEASPAKMRASHIVAVPSATIAAATAPLSTAAAASTTATTASPTPTKAAAAVATTTTSSSPHAPTVTAVASPSPPPKRASPAVVHHKMSSPPMRVPAAHVNANAAASTATHGNVLRERPTSAHAKTTTSGAHARARPASAGAAGTKPVATKSAVANKATMVKAANSASTGVHAWPAERIDDLGGDLMRNDEGSDDDDDDENDEHEANVFAATFFAPAHLKASARPSTAPGVRSVKSATTSSSSSSSTLRPVHVGALALSSSKSGASLGPHSARAAWNTSTVVDALTSDTDAQNSVTGSNAGKVPTLRPHTAPHGGRDHDAASSTLHSARPSTARLSTAASSASFLAPRPASALARNVLVANTSVRKCDRVQRMAAYRSEWKAAAARQKSTAAAVAQVKAFMRQRPVALKKTAPQSRVPPPNALAAPTDKKRHEVRWQIRAQFMLPNADK